MPQISAISTVVKQLEPLFQWVLNEDERNRKGFLKQENADAGWGTERVPHFSVQIRLSSQFMVELENNFFPEVELHFSSSSTSPEEADPFLVVNVLEGWYDYDWRRENIDKSQVIASALDLTNQIRAALSISNLNQFPEDENSFWLVV
ncbi:hypothetical protein [Gloeothece verrucosa]|uniref:Uncharacterized protein n=1 Tax=Gloeothece verrucosa (strain PCC 7822) TaxID=497965 RepID=E0U7K9_GLOV7|nr:hypothetical protein [Gloeothece verrucosa]ADN13705.1 hypothetical protein Cyan7822_1717 [Gloeothece verrucosa PCC 7822]